MSIEKLKEKLDILIKHPALKVCDNYIHVELGEDECPIDNEYNKLILEIEYNANEELINNDGTPNFRAHRILEGLGYRVVKGESDSFGWLTGVIITPVGNFVYG